MYSQIDKIKFHTRERFANAIVNAFKEAEDKVYVDYWTVWNPATNMVSFCNSLGNTTITILLLNMLSKLKKKAF